MELVVRIVEIDAGKPIAILNREDAAELGAHPLDRVTISSGKKKITVIVNTSNHLLKRGEIAVYHEIAHALGLKSRQSVSVVKREELKSKEFIHNRIDGIELKPREIKEIVEDVVELKLNDLKIAAFITTLYKNPVSLEEAVGLSKAMVETGKRYSFGKKYVLDKHSIGGCPGDKTTLLLTPIIAAAGLTIPKTSSRSITSPAGTADRAEVLMPVNLSLNEIKRVVKKTNGCIVWGGALDMAPADDLFIRVEHPLGLDPMLLPSIISKKKCIGATHVVIDIPTGRGSKIKTFGQAKRLSDDFIHIGKEVGLKIDCGITLGEQPIGYTMGPALEAREALNTIMGSGSSDVVDKATALSGILFAMVGKTHNYEDGKALALKILRSGKAEKKLREFIHEQGGKKTIKPDDIAVGEFKATIKSKETGRVQWINNSELVKIAMAAGTPNDKGAGIQLYAKINDHVKAGDPLYSIYSEKRHKLREAEKIAEEIEPIVVIERLDKHMLTCNISKLSYFSKYTDISR